MNCECGCGKPTPSERRFIRGHAQQLQTPESVWCAKCQDFKTPVEFYRLDRPDWCRTCHGRSRATFYRKNIDRVRVASSRATKRRNMELRQKALTAYGGACACCGEVTQEFLAIDHIEGGGNKHRRALGISGGGGSAFYLWLERNDYPSEFRALCHNCNMAFGLYGQCPHNSPPARVKSNTA